jgi:MerR family transcriptional regulator, heat shock protein HspR
MRRRPVYMIGIAAELIGVHPQTLRMYEQKGLLRPRKSIKNTRLYSQEDVELGRHIQRLTQEMGTNLAGVKRILDLERRLERAEAEGGARRGRRRGTPLLQAGGRAGAAWRDRAQEGVLSRDRDDALLQTP